MGDDEDEVIIIDEDCDEEEEKAKDALDEYRLLEYDLNELWEEWNTSSDEADACWFKL
jgi:FtsZ-binding cell division protein ZapB